MEAAEVTHYWLTRFCFQKALGFVYFIAFLIAINQFRPLIGEHGLYPVPLFLKRANFWDAPSLFWLDSSDRFISLILWGGLVLAVAALTGLSDNFGIYVSTAVWFLLWFFYLSLVNIGQVFYGFGWETLLLETGFLAIFLGSSDTSPPKIVIWLLLWVLFRVMFGAGLIKLRGDQCWRDLTCMNYHYETQPLPNPLSWYFHKLPPLLHKAETLFTHFVELVAPWGLFLPPPFRYITGILMLVFQGTLILSGNLSWLNYITIVLCIPCFDDKFLSRFIPVSVPAVEPLGWMRQGFVFALLALVLYLSIRPTVNLISPRQVMNTSFEPLHLVNTYGAFGSVTRTRNEIIIQGTGDTVITGATKWRDYEFKGKPGDVRRQPCIVSPYHYKLDWQIWFAAMSPYYYHPWFLNLTAKLLKGDRATLKLLANDPFPNAPPRYIRAELYEYHFTGSRKKTGAWWQRTYVREYLPPVSLQDPEFARILDEEGWL